MSLSVHSIASGSSGNSILIRNDDTAVLIDAGIGIRRLTAALGDLQINPSDLSAIMITHEHSDHVAGAVRMAGRFGAPILANAPTLRAIKGASAVPHKVIGVGEDVTFGRLVVRSFPVSHDAVCPVGYTIECGGSVVCSATDTGVPTPAMRAACANADLLILESNHDVNMLRAGPYPWFLKQRIMGNKGHMSNDTAAGLLREIADSGKAITVWLAHLSKTNNSPSVALSTSRRMLADYLGRTLQLEVARRDTPSVSWQSTKSSFQLSLFR